MGFWDVLFKKVKLGLKVCLIGFIIVIVGALLKNIIISIGGALLFWVGVAFIFIGLLSDSTRRSISSFPLPELLLSIPRILFPPKTEEEIKREEEEDRARRIGRAAEEGRIEARENRKRYY